MRFVQPDPVLDVPADERAARTWGHDPLLQVQGVGAFVRVLLPIRLTDGYTLTVGTWLGINPAILRSVWEIWDTSEYASLVLDGFLANRIPPWGDHVLGAPATAKVRDPEQWPYVTDTGHADLAGVLTTEWPHDLVLDAYRSIV